MNTMIADAVGMAANMVLDYEYCWECVQLLESSVTIAVYGSKYTRDMSEEEALSLGPRLSALNSMKNCTITVSRFEGGITALTVEWPARKIEMSEAAKEVAARVLVALHRGFAGHTFYKSVFSSDVATELTGAGFVVSASMGSTTVDGRGIENIEEFVRAADLSAAMKTALEGAILESVRHELYLSGEDALLEAQNRASLVRLYEEYLAK